MKLGVSVHEHNLFGSAPAFVAFIGAGLVLRGPFLIAWYFPATEQ
jgi:hypothetical protein